jgi:cell division protein FtsN
LKSRCKNRCKAKSGGYFYDRKPDAFGNAHSKEEKLPYHIVAGAFRDEENAEKVFTDLLANGFKARRIAPNRHGLFPVLYGSFATKAGVNKHEEIHKINPDAWLMTREL